MYLNAQRTPLRFTPHNPRASTTTRTSLATLVTLTFALSAIGGTVRPAHAGDTPTPTIPGLVVAPPSTPSGQPTSAPGLFVTPPSMPHAAPQPAPKPKPKSSSSHRRSKPSRSADASPPKAQSTKIVALVNDEPITGFNVDQRARFLALSSNIGDRARAQMKAFAQDPRTNARLKAILQETIASNRGRTREQVIAAFEARKKAYVVSLQRQAIESARAGVIPTLRKKALDELIDERLKLQEAKKLSIKVDDGDVEKMIGEMAQRNKMTIAQFGEHLAKQGAHINVLRSRLKVSLVWRDVVRKRYGYQINVSQREIEELALRSGAEESQELKLGLITIESPGKPDQRAMAARLSEANDIRAKFKGCKSLAQLAKGQPNAKYQDLGFKKVGTISEPTRSLLLSARDGEMIPPNLSGASVEIYAVCGRRGSGIDEDQRKAAETKLTMQEFEKLAQRYLYDLRKDALIERR